MKCNQEPSDNNAQAYVARHFHIWPGSRYVICLDDKFGDEYYIYMFA